MRKGKVRKLSSKSELDKLYIDGTVWSFMPLSLNNTKGNNFTKVHYYKETEILLKSPRSHCENLFRPLNSKWLCSPFLLAKNIFVFSFEVSIHKHLDIVSVHHFIYLISFCSVSIFTGSVLLYIIHLTNIHLYNQNSPFRNIPSTSFSCLSPCRL